MACTLITLLLLVVQGLTGLGAEEGAGSSAWQDLPEVGSVDVVKVMKVVPIIMLSLGCQVQVPCVYGDLSLRSPTRMRKALASVGGVCFSAYSIVGILGVVAVMQLHGGLEGLVVAANVLDSLPKQAPLALVMRGLMAVAACSVYPMLLLPARSTFDHLLRVSTGQDLEAEGSSGLNAAETLLIVGATVIFGYCGGNLAAVFGFTGATAGALICYMLPPACFLKIRRELPEDLMKSTHTQSILCYCMLAFFAPLSVVEVYLQIMG